MKNVPETSHEQFSPEIWVERAYHDFSMAMIGTTAQLVLIGGFENEQTATKAWLKRRRPGIDRRRKLSPTDANLVEFIEDSAADTSKYVEWLRTEEGQPLYRNALVSYCEAFENCLKKIAVSFNLVECSSKIGGPAQIIVTSKDFKVARRKIETSWKQATDQDEPRVKVFFESCVRSSPPPRSYPNLSDPISDETWDTCGAAFQIRNKVLHTFGYVDRTIYLGATTLHAGDTLELSLSDLRRVREAFDIVLSPFGLSHALGL